MVQATLLGSDPTLLWAFVCVIFTLLLCYCVPSTQHREWHIVGAWQIFVALLPSSQTHVSETGYHFSFFPSTSSLLTSAFHLLACLVLEHVFILWCPAASLPERLAFGFGVTSDTQTPY